MTQEGHKTSMLAPEDRRTYVCCVASSCGTLRYYQVWWTNQRSAGRVLFRSLVCFQFLLFVFTVNFCFAIVTVCTSDFSWMKLTANIGSGIMKLCVQCEEWKWGFSAIEGNYAVVGRGVFGCWIEVLKSRKMADLEAVLADVSYLMAMEKSKCAPAARASKKIVLPDPRWVTGRRLSRSLPV